MAAQTGLSAHVMERLTGITNGSTASHYRRSSKRNLKIALERSKHFMMRICEETWKI